MRFIALLVFWVLLNIQNVGAEKSAPKSTRVPQPILKHETWKGTQCVASEEDIRKNHMDFLLHQRDDTVHEGIRTKKYSLKNCINCHVTTKGKDGAPIPITSREHFCNTCHAYVGVTLDCFQCHATHPDSGQVKTKIIDKITPIIEKHENQAFHSKVKNGGKDE